MPRRNIFWSHFWNCARFGISGISSLHIVTSSTINIYIFMFSSHDVRKKKDQTAANIRCQMVHITHQIQHYLTAEFSVKKKEWLNEWSLVILSIKSYVIVYVCMSMQVCVRTTVLDMTWQVNTWYWTQTTHSKDLFPSLNWTIIYFAHTARSFLVLLFFMQSSWKGVI